MSHVRENFGAALTALTVVAALLLAGVRPAAADTESDSHTVTINSGEIRLVDVLDEHPDEDSVGDNRTPQDDPTETDEDIVISFEADDLTVAGNRTTDAPELEDLGDGDGSNNPWIVWTANASSKITVCNDSINEFEDFTKSSDSRSWLTVANGGGTVVLAEGPSADPSPATVSDGTSCDGSEPTLIGGIGIETGQAELDYKAMYDVADGDLPNGDDTTVTFTIEAD